MNQAGPPPLPPDSRPVIITSFDKIPNLGLNPNIQSIRSGNWSDPATWSLGRVPVATDVASVSGNTDVVFDSPNSAVDVLIVQAQSKLRWNPSIYTKIKLRTFQVLEGGNVEIGTLTSPVQYDFSSMLKVGAEIIFANLPIDTTKDPAQWGNGLICLGNLTTCGVPKTEWATLAVEPLAGATTLRFAHPVVGWNVQDRLALPDTRQLMSNERWSGYVPQWEVLHVASVSADGLTVTLDAPLAFNHKAARNGAGVIDFFPDVGNLSRSIIFRSESSSVSSVRGHCLFTHRAYPNINNTTFHGVGRTTKAAEDNTIFNAQGLPTHIGTNQAGRLPVSFMNHCGPQVPVGPHQYELNGNVVLDTVVNTPFRWGISLNAACHGHLRRNVVFNWAGTGIALLSGNESFNRLDGNLVVGVVGEANPRNNTGLDGSAYWFHGWNNYIVDNVAASAVGKFQGIVAGCGFNLFWQASSGKNTKVPLFPGADLSQSSQYKLINMQLTPILQFQGNRAYGNIATGLTIWWLGTNGYNIGDIGQSVIKDFTAWHAWEEGFFGYPTNNVLFDGFVVRGDVAAIDVYGIGWTAGDYWASNITIKNADIHGMNRGIANSLNTPGTFTVKDSYFRCWDADVQIGTIATPGTQAAGFPQIAALMGRTTVLDNNKYDRLGNNPAFNTIRMAYDAHHDYTHFTLPDKVIVTNYNQVPGDNFQLSYLSQAPSFFVPVSVPARHVTGSPVANMTNDQTWAAYNPDGSTKTDPSAKGLAIAGAVCRSTATRPMITGLVEGAP